ncbi:uncharacterized protein LOC110859391 isoform X2 [Folsomia candida]|uniref:Spermatogenesis-associated protein 7 n=1 Tax=Folsomia candida TaxID=158441 RepID=A0A226DCU7_FOLCA|nr:uncharacterized protein LOC110859391 isoform X2 [Folsomia candida]OXA42654.1 Spermatogenesis-associated protein 7 [Folsomia candida]
MKKVDPFSGIPAVPTSLAGQWLAFSHMASHYRKLLNVKPRVNSSSRPPYTTAGRSAPPISSYLKGAPPKWMSTLMTPPSPSYKAPPCCSASCPNNTTKKPSTSATLSTKTKKVTKNNNNLHAADVMMNVAKDASPANEIQIQSKTTKPKPRFGGSAVNKSIKNKANLETLLSDDSPRNHASSLLYNNANYQMLYGPRSLNSYSTDGAPVSDCESSSQPDEPSVETMGVAEKIKVFLDNLHQFETSNNQSSSSKKKMAKEQSTYDSSCSHCGYSPSLIRKSEPQLPVTTARESRHANCFIPTSTSPTATPKKTAPHNRNRVNMTKSISLSEAIKVSKGVALNKSQKKSVVDENSNNIGRRSMEKKKRYPSGGSTCSVGTIRGSEELATDVIMMMPPTHKLSHHYDHQIPTKDNKAFSRTRTPSAGYCSQSASGKTTMSSTNTHTVNNIKLPKTNKDSSRDSAYGFSSGESRITTRESTPEKLSNKSHKQSSNAGNKTVTSSSKLKGRSSAKRSSAERGRHNSALSTVASSLNANFEPGGGRVVESEMKHKSRKSRLTTDDKYLNFLTEVTDDIVTRGIYTNKGLKMLFKDHAERHRELNVDRMTELLDKLRMDLGIPKDDKLNRLEFGYGSANSHSRGNFSSMRPTPGDPLFSTTTSSKFPTRKRISGLDEAFSDEFMAPPQPHSSYNPMEEVGGDSESGDDIELHSVKSETSLSEAELQRTLKEVGVDSQTTLEIVGMIRKNRSHHPRIVSSNVETDEGSGGGSSDDNVTQISDNNNNPSRILGQPPPTTQSRRVHMSQSCSTPASHCSTTSSS